MAVMMMMMMLLSVRSVLPICTCSSTGGTTRMRLVWMQMRVVVWLVTLSHQSVVVVLWGLRSPVLPPCFSVRHRRRRISLLMLVVSIPMCVVVLLLLLLLLLLVVSERSNSCTL